VLVGVHLGNLRSLLKFCLGNCLWSVLLDVVLIHISKVCVREETFVEYAVPHSTASRQVIGILVHLGIGATDLDLIMLSDGLGVRLGFLVLTQNDA